MTRTPPVAALLWAVLLVGCEAEQQAKPRPRAAETKVVAAPAPTTGSPEPPPEPKPATKAPPQADDFDDRVAEVLALEQDARIFDAMKLCRELRSRFRGHPKARELDALAARLRREKRAAAGLPAVVAKLGSERHDVVEVARRQLLDAGDVGAIFLRKAVREGSGKVAAQAVGLLVALRDPHAQHTFVARLARDPPEELRPTLCDALADLAELLDAGTLSALCSLAACDRAFTNRDIVGVLCAVLERRCGGDGAKLDELAQTPGAHAAIKSYVEEAMASGDAAVAAWAEGIAPAVGWVGHGAHGRYYEGESFERLVFERLDPRIYFSDTTIGYPDGRREHISARWTASLRVATPGKHTFYSESDDGQRLWVDDKLLIDDWREHGASELQATVELTRGWHSLKSEFYNGKSEGLIKVSWSGPGFGKRLLDDTVLRTTPWEGMKKGKGAK